MENHNTNLSPGFTHNKLVPAPANVVVVQDPLGSLPVGSPPSRGTASPVCPEDTWTSVCSRGFVLPTRAPPGIELQSFSLCTPPVYRVLVEFKPSPFSFLSFKFSPYGCFHFSSFQLVLEGGAFPILSPHLRPLPARKSDSLPSAASLSPNSPLCATYLLSPVVQVVWIVVLILKSVF